MTLRHIYSKCYCGMGYKKKEGTSVRGSFDFFFLHKHSNPIILPIEEPASIFKNNLYSFHPELSHYISLPYENFSK